MRRRERGIIIAANPMLFSMLFCFSLHVQNIGRFSVAEQRWVFFMQVSGDGCSSFCVCEQDPCQLKVQPSVWSLASIVSGLSPGATLTLATGTYTSCGWNITSRYGADQRPITIVGADGATIDCEHRGPVVSGIIFGTHLRLEGIHFTNAQHSSSGGVLRAELGSHVVIENCRVTKTGSDGEGGAIFLSNSSLHVGRSHFEENTAEGSGGSLALVDGARVILTDSTFTRCSAGNGGAVYAARGSTLFMERMHFSLNEAFVNKGGNHSE